MTLLIDIGSSHISEQQFAAFVPAMAPAPLALRKSNTALYANAGNARTARASISSAVHAAQGIDILVAEFVAVRGANAPTDMSALRIGVVSPRAPLNTLLGDQIGGCGLELFWQAESGSPKWRANGTATPAGFNLPDGWDHLDFYNVPIRLEIDLAANVLTLRTGLAFATIANLDGIDLRDCFLAASVPPDVSLYMNTGQSPWGSVAQDDGAVRSGWFLPRVQVDPIRIANRPFLSGPADEPANKKWDDRLTSGDVTLRRALRFWPWSDKSGSSASQTTLTLTNHDGGLDAFSTADCRDFPVTLREVSDAGTVLDATALAQLIVDKVTIKSNAAIDITLTDAVAQLDGQLQHRIYDDTAPSGLAGKPAPYARGVARSLPVGVLDSENLLYAYDDAFFGNGGDGSKAASPVAVTLVRDKGFPLYAEDATDNGDGTLTLVRPPVGTIVCDVAPADGKPLTVETFVNEVLVDHAGFDAGQIAAADFRAIDTACEYQSGFGYFLDAAAKISDALADALDTHYSCLWRDAGGNWRCSRLVAPESLAARAHVAGAIDDQDMLADLILAPDLALNFTTAAQGGRNYTPLTDFATDEIVMTAALRAELSAEYRVTCRYSGPLADMYAAARNAPPVGTLLDSIDDVQAFVDYGGSLYAVPRYFSTVTIRRDAVKGIELGQVWRLVYPRYGLDDGAYALVTSIAEGVLNETVTLVLWHAIGIDVLPDPLVLIGAFTASGVAGEAYSSEITISGGDHVYTAPRVLAGKSPEGLELSIIDDRLFLAGTPALTLAGAFSFVAAVDSGDGQTAASQVTINIAWPALALTGDFAGFAAVGYWYQSALTITGGNGTYTNPRVTSGSMPSGLSLSIIDDRLWLLGLAGSGGAYKFEVAVDSADGQTATGAQTIISSVHAQTTHLVYDNTWRLSQIIEQTVAGTNAATLSYDGQGRVDAITGTAPMTISYDAQGRVSQIVEQIDGDPATTTVSYGTDGSVTQTDTLYRGATATAIYGYGAGRVSTITDAAGTATVNYDGAGRIDAITGATPMTVSYDDAGRVSEIAGQIDGDPATTTVSYADDSSVAQTVAVYRGLTSTADVRYDTGHLTDIIVTETTA
jgi:YD repeat-containing protein